MHMVTELLLGLAAGVYLLRSARSVWLSVWCKTPPAPPPWSAMEDRPARSNRAAS